MSPAQHELLLRDAQLAASRLDCGVAANTCAALGGDDHRALRLAAEASLRMGRYTEALQHVRRGKAMLKSSHLRDHAFSELEDAAAIAAAQHGSMAGFDGAELLVAPASDSGVLLLGGGGGGGAADDDCDEQRPELLPLAAGGGGGGGGGGGTALVAAAAATDPALAAVERVAAQRALLASGRAAPFRCLGAALAAARDGDVILLLPGTHLTGQLSLALDKRVALRARGAGVVLDHRSNSPLLRVRRSVLLAGFTLDGAGFAPPLRVEGGAGVAPLLQDVAVLSSGSSALAACGAARPLLQRCRLQGRHNGLLAWGRAAVSLQGCTISKCGQAGVKAMEQAELQLAGCVVEGAGEEGVVVAERASAHLRQVVVTGCTGPGIDVSGSGAVRVLPGCRVEGCGGGLWAWEQGRADGGGAGGAS